jgi:hypothetical protein
MFSRGSRRASPPCIFAMEKRRGVSKLIASSRGYLPPATVTPWVTLRQSISSMSLDFFTNSLISLVGGDDVGQLQCFK